MISVIIPNYNGINHLKVCFDSLREQTRKDFKIVLVDNNSSDNSMKFTEDNYPEIKIIKMNYNTGFAKSVNEGIKYSIENYKAEFILLLNNDTECEKKFLEEIMKGFINDSIGSVACKMINFYDRTKIDDCGDFIKSRGSPYARGFQETDSGQYDKSEYIFGACAGAAVYREEVFEKAGYFDEDFFAYYEDVDFSFRLQIAGFKCLYNPAAVCYHKRGATTGTQSGLQVMLCEKNLIALRIKNYPLSSLIKSFPFFILVRIIRYFRFYRDESPQLFKAAVKGYLKGLLEIPSSLKKRKFIQHNKKVTTKYLESILR
ncbi:MAG: glycosyltransferase family 2 protein [Ignavibacteria bacterium]